MSVLRRHIVLLDQTGAASHTGSSFGIVASDADLIPDAYQTFVALATITRPVPVPPPLPLPPAPAPTPTPIVAAARGLPTPLPGGIELPGTGSPAPAPSGPRPGLPTVPTPGVPTTPAPGVPTAPTPGIPTTPTPGVPTTPTTPTVPVPAPAPVGGAITVDVEGSFDQVHWAPVGTVTLAAGATVLERLVELGPIPPYVRARVSESSGATAFDWTAYVALASTAAFKVRAVA